MKVEVVRSARRRKTVSARKVGDALRVSIPSWMSAAEEEQCVADMVRRIQRRETAGRLDLSGRARLLSGRYGLPVPSSVRWVGNQESRWGSCTPADATIRISDRLAGAPGWVIDYVLVHELAHLSVHGHGPRFWELVERYPLTERARGYLIAKGMEGFEEEGTGQPLW
jgi:predicted metal-dependent hydrolase